MSDDHLKNIDASTIRYSSFAPGSMKTRVVHELLASRRIADLDDDERLVFWLREVSQFTGRGFRHRHPPFFDFESERLVDLDDDGWLEYVSADGDPFFVRGQCVIVPTGATYLVSDSLTPD